MDLKTAQVKVDAARAALVCAERDKRPAGKGVRVMFAQRALRAAEYDLIRLRPSFTPEAMEALILTRGKKIPKYKSTPMRVTQATIDREGKAYRIPSLCHVYWAAECISVGEDGEVNISYTGQPVPPEVARNYVESFIRSNNLIL